MCHARRRVRRIRLASKSGTESSPSLDRDDWQHSSRRATHEMPIEDRADHSYSTNLPCGFFRHRIGFDFSLHSASTARGAGAIQCGGERNEQCGCLESDRRQLQRCCLRSDLQHGAISGATTAPNPNVVTVTATVLSDLSVTASAAAIIGSSSDVKVTVSPTAATVLVGQQQQFVSSLAGRR